MTEKERFKLHIKWFNPAKTNGEATLTDNGQPILCTERIEDARLLKNLLNELSNENEQLKFEINMLKNTIGRNEAFIKRITSNGEWNNTSMKQGD